MSFTSRTDLLALVAVLALIVQSLAPPAESGPCWPPGCAAPPLTGLVADGGLEAGTPNPVWTEYSSDPGRPTPICTTSSCGFAGARTGEAWAFFGGVDGTANTGAIEQAVTIPPGKATLNFFVWIPEASGNGTDLLRVLLDGQQLLAFQESDETYRGGYQQAAVDVSAFADGGAHLLRFESQTSGTPSNSDFFIDDVTLTVCGAVSLPGGVPIVIQGVRIAEGNTGLTEAQFPVTIASMSPSSFPVSVAFATSDVTAVAGDDYDAASGTLTFLPGEVQKEIAVTIRGDTIEEPCETFAVSLSDPVNGFLHSSEVVGTIVDNDTPLAEETMTIVLPIGGVESMDGYGDEDNVVLETTLTRGPTTVIGIGWDVTIETLVLGACGWLSEAVLYPDGSDRDGSGPFLRPGAGGDFSGTGSYSSPVADLACYGSPGIPIMDDGKLYIEFFEDIDSPTDSADAVYLPGSSVTIQFIVEPIFADGFESGDISAWSSAIP